MVNFFDKLPFPLGGEGGKSFSTGHGEKCADDRLHGEDIGWRYFLNSRRIYFHAFNDDDVYPIDVYCMHPKRHGLSQKKRAIDLRRGLGNLRGALQDETAVLEKSTPTVRDTGIDGEEGGHLEGSPTRIKEGKHA